MATTRGLVGAALVSLQRTHWPMPSPYVFVTDQGIAHDLTLASPKRVGRELRLGVIRHRALRRGGQWDPIT